MPNQKRWANFIYKKRFLILLGGFLIINISVWSDLVIKRSPNIEFGPFQTALLGVGLLIFTFGLYLQFPKPVSGIYKVLSIAFFVVGIILTCINLVGVFIPLRDPEISTKEFQPYGVTKNVQYNQDEVFKAIDQRPNEENAAYTYRLVDLVFDNTLHFFDPTNPGKYHQRVPIYENFILFTRSFSPSVTDHYEFCDPYRALERGVGLCSQFSKIIYAILKQNGIPARIQVLTGHVVTEGLIDKGSDQWWILDADLGVVIEHDLETLENNPEIVADIYRENGYSQELSTKIAEIYGPDGNYIQTNTDYCRSETQRYIYKWWWPVGMMIPFGLLKISGLKKIFEPKMQRE